MPSASKERMPGLMGGRNDEFLGEMLICVDRVTGDLSFLPTGGIMGVNGPFTQKTKIYFGEKRKIPLAVVYHRGSAVRGVAGQANREALKKSLMPLLREACILELLEMDEPSYQAALGTRVLDRLSDSPSNAVWRRGIPSSLSDLARAISAERARLGAGGLIPGSGDYHLAAERVLGALTPVGVSGRLAVDLLMDLSSEGQLDFPFSVTKGSYYGSLHFHGVNGRLIKSIFQGIESSPDFVLHSSSSPSYDKTYRIPFEKGLNRIAAELDSPAHQMSRLSRLQALAAMRSTMSEGNAGFLDLVKGAGVAGRDFKRSAPDEAMMTMLGPGAVPDESTGAELRKIAEKIDEIQQRLGISSEATRCGTVRDFCNLVSSRKEAALEVFGTERVENLLAAHYSIKHANKSGEEDLRDVIEKERRLLPQEVAKCLSSYIFKDSGGEKNPKAEIVERLVDEAANVEFIYFAAQSGAGDLLKIGKAKDVETRMSDLSREGTDIVLVAQMAIPSLPVGGWMLGSMEDAARKTWGGGAAAKIRKCLGRLEKSHNATEEKDPIAFFKDIVSAGISRKIAAVGGVWASKKADRPDSLNERECCRILTETGVIGEDGAKAVYDLIQTVASLQTAPTSSIAGQIALRKAIGKALSSVGRDMSSPPENSPGLEEGFYAVDERTQMPLHPDAWKWRMQTGALVAEGILHRRYSVAHVYGEWFSLLGGVREIVQESEAMFGSRAAWGFRGEDGRADPSLVGLLQEGGQPVVSRVSFLHQGRDAYEDSAKKMLKEEKDVKYKGKAAGGVREKRVEDTNDVLQGRTTAAGPKLPSVLGDVDVRLLRDIAEAGILCGGERKWLSSAGGSKTIALTKDAISLLHDTDISRILHTLTDPSGEVGAAREAAVSFYRRCSERFTSPKNKVMAMAVAMFSARGGTDEEIASKINCGIKASGLGRMAGKTAATTREEWEERKVFLEQEREARSRRDEQLRGFPRDVEVTDPLRPPEAPGRLDRLIT